MKYFVATLFVSCSLLSLSATGAPNRGHNFNDFDCAESYRGQAAERTAGPRKRTSSDRESAEEKDNNSPPLKKPNTGAGRNEQQNQLSAEMSNAYPSQSSPVQREDLSLSAVLQNKDLPEVALNIVHFLPSEDQQNFARVSRGSHTLITQYRLQHDSRKLQENPWVEGPLVKSPSLYYFNAAVFQALKQMITVDDDRRKRALTQHPLTQEQALEKIVPIAKACTFLTTTFSASYPKATKRVVRFLSNAYISVTGYSSVLEMSSDLLTLAGDPENNAERELMRQGRYLTQPGYNPTQGFYADLQQDPDQMGLVKRHYLTEQKRIALWLTPQPTGLSETELQAWYKKHAEDWDFIVQYGIVISADDFRAAAIAHYRAQNYSRAAELFKSVLTKYPDRVTVHDSRNIAAAHYGAKNYSQAAKLYEKVLTEYDDQVTINDLTITAAAHFNACNYGPAAKLCERILMEYDDQVGVGDLKRFALAHFRNYNFDRALECLLRVDELAPAEQENGIFRLALFITLHANPHKYAKKIQELLKGDMLTPSEKDTYSSLFRGNEDQILHALDSYISNPANHDPEASAINKIVYQVAFILYSKAGDKEKVEEIKARFD